MANDFPPSFFWGASTSAHQVEGDNNNDWSEWEKSHANWLAEQAPKRFAHWLPAWERIKPEATNPQNYISGKAADHYHLYEQDFNILQKLHLNAYRFSLEWSRIEPREGEYDEAEIKHYTDLIAALERRGITPFITIWHWTIPLWVRDQGGWANSKTIQDFAKFCAKVAAVFPHVKYWITENEPEVYANQSYLEGYWPPQKRNFFSYWRVSRNLARGHIAGYDAIKQVNANAHVGIVMNNAYYDPVDGHFYNKLLAPIFSWWANRRILNSFGSRLDFVGVNYYFRSPVNLFRAPITKAEHSDLGWELDTKGIYHVLKELQHLGKPVFVTENGLADALDTYRGQYIQDILQYVQQAIKEGVDVRGYFHWSLLDNFEWDKGFWPRFGLIEVDFPTQERKIRPSAITYSQLAQANQKPVM